MPERTSGGRRKEKEEEAAAELGCGLHHETTLESLQLSTRFLARHPYTHGKTSRLTRNTGLYTDESPGLKVDPFVVLVLSVGFIISVVGLHSKYTSPTLFDSTDSFPVIAKVTRKFSA